MGKIWINSFAVFATHSQRNICEQRTARSSSVPLHVMNGGVVAVPRAPIDSTARAFCVLASATAALVDLASSQCARAVPFSLRPPMNKRIAG
jgi:hypothetical protein